MKTMSIAVLAAVLVATGGCLMAETQEEAFTLHADGHRGEYVIRLENIQTDGATPHHQQKDFDAMVDLLKSDEYLLDRVRSGVYVRRRDLTVEKGLLVGREVGLFSDPSNVGLMRYPDSTMRRRIGVGRRVMSTNGEVYQEGDSIYVVWPRRERRFILVLKDEKFHPAASLVERYRTWKAKQK